MKIKEIITEGKSTNVVVVDVQPAYHATWYAQKIITFLEKQKGDIVAFYNSEEFSNDTHDEVVIFWEENGATNELLERITWSEKSYGFLRSWMDEGVSDRIIIKVIRYMVTNNLNDSRDIEDLQELIGTNNYNSWMEDDPIYVPNEVSLAKLKSLSPFYLCGGSRSECLREIQLLCNAFNIKHKTIDSLIYG